VYGFGDGTYGLHAEYFDSSVKFLYPAEDRYFTFYVEFKYLEEWYMYNENLLFSIARTLRNMEGF